ncbi:hypothetical protein TNCT1_36000 [Streptomyces sp. 1-11]|nr:hypothetical protein TNCT1_36000 [Streptomyces sp. 1-11]
MCSSFPCGWGAFDVSGVLDTSAPHAYLRWCNAHARHRDVLPAGRKERARIRSEAGVRQGGRSLATAASRPGELMRSLQERGTARPASTRSYAFDQPRSQSTSR